MFGDPWRRVRSANAEGVEWHGFRDAALQHVQEINELAAPLLAEQSSRPLASADDFKVDLWVTTTMHAGGFDLANRISILLQSGLVDVAVKLRSARTSALHVGRSGRRTANRCQ